MPATLLLTEALADSLAHAVESGVPIETATQAAGVSRETFYEWLRVADRKTWHDGLPVSESALTIISAFADKIRIAQAKFEARCVQRIVQAGEVANEKTGQIDWRAPAWVLNNHPRYRSTYRQHRELEVHNSGTVSHELKLASTLDDDALMAAYQQLDQQALPPAQP